MEPNPSPQPQVLPVFPLPDYFLFPGVVAPLQVFETRYRQMMEDLMDGPGRLAVAPLRAEAPQDNGLPRLPAVGTLAEIMRHEKLPDGRWLILLAALDRVSLVEVKTDRLYRRVTAEIRPEPATQGEPAAALRERVTAALQARADGQWEAAAEVALGRLADLLLHSLELAPELARKAYFEADPCRRAAMALAWLDLKTQAAE